jgi:hypothetical protein
VRVAGVVQHEVGDHPDAPLVRLVQQVHEVIHRAELGQHGPEVTDVVAAVAQRRGVERRQPQTVHPEPRQIVELAGQSAQVAGAVAVRVGERPDQHLVEDGPLVPLRLVRRGPRVLEVRGLRLRQVPVGHHGVSGVRHRGPPCLAALPLVDRCHLYHFSAASAATHVRGIDHGRSVVLAAAGPAVRVEWTS